MWGKFSLNVWVDVFIIVSLVERYQDCNSLSLKETGKVLYQKFISVHRRANYLKFADVCGNRRKLLFWRRSWSSTNPGKVFYILEHNGGWESCNPPDRLHVGKECDVHSSRACVHVTPLQETSLEKRPVLCMALMRLQRLWSKVAVWAQIHAEFERKSDMFKPVIKTKSSPVRDLRHGCAVSQILPDN